MTSARSYYASQIGTDPVTGLPIGPDYQTASGGYSAPTADASGYTAPTESAAGYTAPTTDALDILLELLLAVIAQQQQHLVEAMPQQRRVLDLDMGHQLHRDIIQMLKHLHQGMTLQAKPLVLVMAVEK